VRLTPCLGYLWWQNAVNVSIHHKVRDACAALQTPMRIVYLDNTVDAGGAAVLNHHDFKPEACDADTTPCFTMLYRPGHYDLLNRL
jgi:hypothetical protein